MAARLPWMTVPANARDSKWSPTPRWPGIRFVHGPVTGIRSRAAGAGGRAPRSVGLGPAACRAFLLMEQSADGGDSGAVRCSARNGPEETPTREPHQHWRPASTSASAYLEVRPRTRRGRASCASKTHLPRRHPDADLDLVSAAPDARPPVCKIMDYRVQQVRRRRRRASLARTSADRVR